MFPKPKTAQPCAWHPIREAAVRATWPNHVILRSSIITGPPPPLQPVGRPLMTVGRGL